MQLPKHSWFYDAVSALVYSLMNPYAIQSEPAPFNDITRFVLRQHSQMPDYLRTPMHAAALVFDAAGVARNGKRFHRLPPEIRHQQVADWKNSRVGFQRDLIRYFESLAIFALHDREEARSPSSEQENSGPNVVENPVEQLCAEIVVVGSGPGGAITACFLAEGGRDVLLVEEGPFHSQNSCEPFSKDEMLQKYRNGGQTVALGKNKITYVEGCCVGGGSEINSALYHRTPPEMLERWRNEFRVDGLTAAEMQPHFDACERDLSVSPLPCTAPLASLKLWEGARHLGWKSLEIPRCFHYERPDSPAGTRQSMTKIFIPRFLKAGGKVLPRTRVLKFRQDGTKWLLAAENGQSKPVCILAETVFFCAGAVQTPALLRRSGITQNLGDSLQVHPTLKVVAQFPETVNTPGMGVPVHQVKEFAPRLSFGCSISSPPHLALGLLDHPQAAREVAGAWRQMAIYYAMIVSEGRGTVRPVPAFRDPLVRYVLTENDRRNLAVGLRKIVELLFESGAQKIYPCLTRGEKLLSRRDAVNLPEIFPNGMANLMTIHLFSSCPMGEDRNKCATDSFGRVHGIKNLFINDASLLCTAPGVNPQGSIMALARRNVLHFLNS